MHTKTIIRAKGLRSLGGYYITNSQVFDLFRKYGGLDFTNLERISDYLASVKALEAEKNTIVYIDRTTKLEKLLEKREVPFRAVRVNSGGVISQPVIPFVSLKALNLYLSMHNVKMFNAIKKATENKEILYIDRITEVEVGTIRNKFGDKLSDHLTESSIYNIPKRFTINVAQEERLNMARKISGETISEFARNAVEQRIKQLIEKQ